MPGCTHYGINGVKNALPALMLWRCGKEEFVADLAGHINPATMALASDMSWAVQTERIA